MEILKKAIFKYKQSDNDGFFDLKAAQEVLLGILSDFQRFCDDNGIQFSLTYGSLLGAVRDKNIIEWDDDIDLMMTRENIDKLMKILHKLPDYNLEYYHFSNVKNIYTNEVRIYRKDFFRILDDNGVYYLTPLCIDIFPFDKISDCPNAKALVKRNKILKKITREKNILTLKQAKYKSRSRIRALARKIKKSLYFFETQNRLHKSIEAQIKKLYTGGSNYGLFSPFANESYSVIYDKTLFDDIIEIKFGPLITYSIKKNEEFLSLVYGEWKKPVDRSSGENKKLFFVKREGIKI